MIDFSEFRKIKPTDEYNPFIKVDFDSFLVSFREFLPQFPADVVKQWPYRHFDEFCEKCPSLDYETLSFREGYLSIREIQQLKPYWSNYDFDSQGGQLLDYTGGTLAEEMKTLHTWPQRIIVMEAMDENTSRGDKQYSLLEGHTRLSIMRELIKRSYTCLDYHQVWIAVKEEQSLSI